MSTFRVSLETIDSVWAHPNADRLNLASVEGMSFQFVVAKDKHQVGDRVLYFPIDSLMPKDLSKKLGLEGRLAGKDRNRLKTVKLRGQISQGLVSYPQDLGLDLEKAEQLETMDGLTAHFGITKYDPPPIPCQNADLVRLPEDVEVYDIEGADRYSSVLAKLLHIPVRVTEKLEGTNWSVTITENKEVMVNQRNYSIAEHAGKEHFFWKIAREHGWVDAARKTQDMIYRYAQHPSEKPTQVTLRGEMVGPGVQGNLYGLKEHRVYLFDVLIDTGSNKHYLNGELFSQFVKDLSHPMQEVVPILAEDVVLSDWLSGKTIQEASNGKSRLNPSARREGIVITPMKEQDDSSVGRLILKMRSPDYLAKSDL